MEKINKQFCNITLILFTTFIFLWDFSIFGLQFRSLILFMFLLIFLDFKRKIHSLFNSKLIIFAVIFFHLYYNLEFDLSFSRLFSFFVLCYLSILIFLYKDIFLFNIDKIILFFSFFLFIFLVGYFFLSYSNSIALPIYDFFNTTNFIFKESSHFGMIVSSVLVYSLNKFLLKKNFYFLFNFIFLISIAWLNFSLAAFATLFMSSLILFFTNFFYINTKQKFLLIFLSILSAFLIWSNQIGLGKILRLQDVARQDLKESGYQDLSVEVLTTSYKIMFYSIKEKPFGYGFNNYETAFYKHIDKIKVYHAITRELNTNDASNNFVKITTEFGFFTFVIAFFVVLFLFSKKIDMNIKLFIIPNFICQTFIRGAGYFNGGYILFLLIIFFLVYEKNLKRD
jgi:hypothetical protein